MYQMQQADQRGDLYRGRDKHTWAVLPDMCADRYI
jgi:hypothetical protein